MAAPSHGEMAAMILPWTCGGVSAAMMRSFSWGAIASGRLQSKYDEAEADDDVYDGADDEVSCGRERHEEG